MGHPGDVGGGRGGKEGGGAAGEGGAAGPPGARPPRGARPPPSPPRAPHGLAAVDGGDGARSPSPPGKPREASSRAVRLEALRVPPAPGAPPRDPLPGHAVFVSFNAYAPGRPLPPTDPAVLARAEMARGAAEAAAARGLPPPGWSGPKGRWAERGRGGRRRVLVDDSWRGAGRGARGGGEGRGAAGAALPPPWHAPSPFDSGLQHPAPTLAHLLAAGQLLAAVVAALPPAEGVAGSGAGAPPRPPRE